MTLLEFGSGGWGGGAHWVYARMRCGEYWVVSGIVDGMGWGLRGACRGTGRGLGLLFGVSVGGLGESDYTGSPRVGEGAWVMM